MNNFIKDAIRSNSFLKSSVWNGPLIAQHAIQRTNEKKWTEMNDQERKKVNKIVQTYKKVTKPDKKLDKIVQT